MFSWPSRPTASAFPIIRSLIVTSKCTAHWSGSRWDFCLTKRPQFSHWVAWPSLPFCKQTLFPFVLGSQSQLLQFKTFFQVNTNLFPSELFPVRWEPLSVPVWPSWLGRWQAPPNWLSCMLVVRMRYHGSKWLVAYGHKTGVGRQHNGSNKSMQKMQRLDVLSRRWQALQDSSSRQTKRVQMAPRTASFLWAGG